MSLDSSLCNLTARYSARWHVCGFFRTVSWLGDGWFWYALMGVMALSGGRVGALAALQMLLTGFLAWLLYRAIKRHTRRPRPYQAHRDVLARAAVLDEYSFPSGHTLHAVSFTMVATGWFPWLTLPLVLFTALVAVSRVCLGLHYPSDVLAGALLGSAFGAASLEMAAMLGVMPG